MTQYVMDQMAKDQALKNELRLMQRAEDNAFMRDKFGREYGMDESKMDLGPVRQMAQAKLLMDKYGIDDATARQLIANLGFGGATATLDFQRGK